MKIYNQFLDTFGNKYSFNNYEDFAKFWFGLSRKVQLSHFPDNFNKIDKSYISKYSRSESGKETTGLHFGVFQNVLNRIFGQREWLGSGVKDKSYDTQNCGYINSYYGSEKHEDIGIEVFGTSSYGDAYYGYSGSIRFKFI